jgi:hypothetical protein
VIHTSVQPDAPSVTDAPTDTKTPAVLPTIASPDFSSATDATVNDEEIDLMVRAISHQSQNASSLCLGCHLPGHKLEDCKCFVDYIIAEGLA